MECLLILSFSSQAQQEKIDTIEANVSIAAANVEEGTQSLGKVRGVGTLPLGDRFHSTPLLHSAYPTIDSPQSARKPQLGEREREGEGGRW